jgi:hypothetical protein
VKLRADTAPQAWSSWLIIACLWDALMLACFSAPLLTSALSALKGKPVDPPAKFVLNRPAELPADLFTMHLSA